MTYQQAMRKLYTDMQLRGFSELTIDAYFLNVKRFLNQTTKTDLKTLNEADFRSFLTMLHQAGDVKASKINNYNSILRTGERNTASGTGETGAEQSSAPSIWYYAG